MSTAADNESGDSGRVVRLTIPARPEYIALCRLALMGISRLRVFSEELLEDLKLALTEACTNSVRHAYGEGANGGVVEIVYELHPHSLAIEVTDNGHGFDPDSPPRDGEPLAEGGLGISIIRAIADEVQIGPRPDGAGSRLRFIKTLT
ncbi:MAG: ATP-binding protein [Actinobacteria bacterium]|nr:MAG: ATP-binding protein [Actinomycetota bacterium]